ncbi:hypothetical protein ACCQ21_15585 [Xanthomonas axonopodis pv. desmodiigangetici]|uniref:hypothetical protein n=1 Tax=Xanthomonas axonopodis TaxID=53413 RepID=UPI0035580F0E
MKASLFTSLLMMVSMIQNAIVDTGEAIAQQNGTYTLEKNTVSNPVPTSWKHD